MIKAGDLDTIKAWADQLVDRQAQRVIESPWPRAEMAGVGVHCHEHPRERIEVLEPARRLPVPIVAALPALDAGLPFDKQGQTFLEAVMLGQAAKTGQPRRRVIRSGRGRRSPGRRKRRRARDATAGPCLPAPR